MITYKSLIQYFDKVCSEHSQINSFTYGEMNFMDDDKFNQYPAVHLSPSVTSIDDQVVVYGCDIIVFDRYDTDEDKMVNEMNCLSDALLLLQDLCAEFSNGKYFIHEDTNIRLQIPVNATPFIDTKPDNVSGWSTSFEVETPNEIDRCNIPYYKSDILHAEEYTLPVTFAEDFAWWSMDKIHSQASFDGAGELTSLIPLLDTISGSDTLNLTGSSLKYDFNDRALHFLDTDISNPCRLQHDAVTSSSNTWFVKIKDFNEHGNEPNTLNNIMFIGDVTGFTDGYMLRITSTGTFQLISYSDSSSMETIVITDPDGLKRKEPFVFAIQLVDLTSVKIIIEGGQTFTLSTDFKLYNEIWGIGSPDNAYDCDFKMSELIWTKGITSQQDTSDVIEWLKYR